MRKVSKDVEIERDAVAGREPVSFTGRTGVTRARTMTVVSA